MALRQKIRQILNEAGINNQTIAKIAKKAIYETVEKRIDHAFEITPDLQQLMTKNIEKKQSDVIIKQIKYTVQERINEACRNIKIDVHVNP